MSSLRAGLGHGPWIRTMSDAIFPWSDLMVWLAWSHFSKPLGPLLLIFSYIFRFTYNPLLERSPLLIFPCNENGHLNHSRQKLSSSYLPLKEGLLHFKPSTNTSHWLKKTPSTLLVHLLQPICCCTSYYYYYDMIWVFFICVCVSEKQVSKWAICLRSIEGWKEILIRESYLGT